MLVSKACMFYLSDIVWENASVLHSHSLMDNIWFVYVQVHELLQIYNEHGVLSERLLFKIPATWQVSIHHSNL
jgi:hypothetical protein